MLCHRKLPFRFRSVEIAAVFIPVLFLFSSLLSPETANAVEVSGSLQPDSPILIRGAADDAAVRDLYETWSTMYGLEDAVPPSSVAPKLGWIEEGQQYPLAPHLKNCEISVEKSMGLERRGPKGEPPRWLKSFETTGEAYPPWVAGSDAENTLQTRAMQAFLWSHQHPRNCRDPVLKFAIVSWATPTGHGLGSSLHIMSLALAFVIESGRILVPSPNTFKRATGEECEGRDKGSLNCYFFPFVSRECEAEAVKALRRQKREEQQEKERQVFRLSLPPRVIHIKGKAADIWPRRHYWVPKFLGKLALNGTKCMELLGEEYSAGKKEDSKSFNHPQSLLAGWFRAQVTRYMLRSPTKLLCHEINRVRQKVYGRQVARDIMDSAASQSQIVAVTRNADPSEADIMDSVKISHISSLESGCWAEEDAYIPRPIVSIHVRQGDKGGEMRLFNFSSFMFLAERLRRHVPNLNTVWLSTEMQNVIDESRIYATWKFLYTHNYRMTGTTRMTDYENATGVHKLLVLSFANLIIASECDYFVGVLRSNWNRLINELRLTNGRLRSGYLTLNYEEF